MPNGLHNDHRSLKHLARLVIDGVLPLPQFYAACVERLVDTERAERLLNETRAAVAEENRQRSESAERMARYLLGKSDQPELPLTAGQWIAQSVGENAVLVKPQPARVVVGCIDV